MSTLPQRKHHRLSGYDYGQYGYYYVTICTRSKENLLAQIVPGSLTTTPTPIGEKAIECWKNIAILNKNVEVDKFVLMPNHLHGIIILKNTDAVAQAEKRFSFEISEQPGRRSLQGLIKDFKSVTTRYYKKMYHTDTSLWQASFYDEVIRNQTHYLTVWNYIDGNPGKWQEDEMFWPPDSHP